MPVTIEFAQGQPVVGPTGPTGPAGPTGATAQLTLRNDTTTVGTDSTLDFVPSTDVTLTTVGDTIEIALPSGPPGSILQDATLNDQTGTSYTIQESDNGKLVTLNNASGIAVTVPSGLGVGFNVTLLQLGAGQVTVGAGSGVTIANRYGHTKTSGNKAVASLIAYAADTFVLSGDTSS